MCFRSAGSKNFGKVSAKTAIKGEFNAEAFHKELLADCKKVKKTQKAIRKDPFDVDYNEALRVVGTGGCAPAPPKTKLRIHPKILPKKEIQRLKTASKVISLEERFAEVERLAQENRRIIEESEARKKLLREFDEAKIKAKQSKEVAPKKDDLELDDEEKRKVLDRAFMAKQEREEEVKKANKIILEAKCHVIREAQVAEKHEMAREWKEEERRLEKMMLEEIAKAFKIADEKNIKNEEEKKKYAEDIRRQLEEREFLRKKEAERIEEEAKIRALATAAMEKEDQQKAEQARVKRAKLRDDLLRVGEMTKFFKKMQFQSEQDAEMKVLEFMRAREEREKKLAMEQKLAKEALQRTQDKLLSQQMKNLSTKAQRDEMILRREEERKEREFRQKEKEAALKKKKLAEDIAETRRMQLEDARQRQAIQIARDEKDFKKVIDRLKKEESKEKQLEEMRLREKDKYREEIIRQMNNKEMERREMQRRAKNEFLASQEKEKTREDNVRAVIKAKLNQMRESNLPEKYIKDVAKQLKIAVE